MDQPTSDVNYISGFYGPGAWAVWVITMIASWISLIQNDYKHNLHFIAYALYTNWAAIDFMRKIAEIPNVKSISKEADTAWLENIAASSAVIYTGVGQAIIQVQICFFKDRLYTFDNDHPIWRRRLIMCAGSVLPFIAVSLAAFVAVMLLNPHLTSGAAFLMTFVCLSLFFLERDRLLVNNRNPYKCIEIALFSLAFTSIVSFSFFTLGLAVGRAPFTFDLFHKSTFIHGKCYCVPCAPQSVGERDQAFSLLAALFLFLYEFGSELIRFGKKALRIVHEVCQ